MPEALTDKDLLTDLLMDAKFLSKQCHLGVMESASEPVRNEFIRMMNDHLNHQWQIYKAMEQRGWYQPLMMQR